MFCGHCQATIQKGLKALDGVKSVSVSYKTGEADVAYDEDRISLREIEEKIRALGYEPVPDAGTDLVRTVCLVAIIIALYVILQRFGILNLLVPNRLAESGMGYGALFLTGLLTSVHCIAMCGGINLSQSLLRQDRDEGRSRTASFPALAYNLGRVVSYTAIGFVLGFAGMLLGGGDSAGVPALLQGALKIIAGAVMIIMGINMLGVFPWLRRNPGTSGILSGGVLGRLRGAARSPFAIGLLNGLMPCGPLQSMQILALASGNPAAGALSMLAFSLGTVPLMLGLGTLVSVLGRRFARTVMNAGAVLVAVLGLAMLSQGGSLTGMLLPDRLLAVVVMLAAAGIAYSVPMPKQAYRLAAACAVAVVVAAGSLALRGSGTGQIADGSSDIRIVDGVQVVGSTLASGRYPTITVQAGMPVRWIIDAPEGSVNGCNYRAVISEYGITHDFKEGENVIEFTPSDAGTVDYTCWMGMIHGSIIVV